MEIGAVFISMYFPSEWQSWQWSWLAQLLKTTYLEQQNIEVFSMQQRSITDFPYANMPEHECCTVLIAL
jgi:hypothetical protein